MKRWHEEYSRTFREWKRHWLQHVDQNLDWQKEPGKDPYEIDCACDNQKGRFRKMRAFDCGNARCYLCHSDKFPKREKTNQEIISDLKFQEGINDLGEN